MRRRELSEIAKRSEEELRLSRAAAERHALAFERLMSAFDRHEQAFERHEQGFERVMAALDSHEAQTGDLGVFIRDMNRRSEKVINDLLRGNREFCKELTAKTDSTTEKILARLDDAREESKAHREALLAMIDRLPPPQAT
jgi:predicted secreted Zn-dependent protease